MTVQEAYERVAAWAGVDPEQIRADVQGMMTAMIVDGVGYRGDFVPLDFVVKGTLSTFEDTRRFRVYTRPDWRETLAKAEAARRRVLAWGARS